MQHNLRNIAKRQPNFFALTPLIVFLLMYLVTSLILQDFYKIPITIAFLFSCIYVVDTFSCFAQGLIPYGAQMLLAAGLCKIAPSSITPYLFYPFLMGLCALLSIVFYKPKTKKNAKVSLQP